MTQGNSTDDRPTTRAERYEHGRGVFGAVNAAELGALHGVLAALVRSLRTPTEDSAAA